MKFSFRSPAIDSVNIIKNMKDQLSGQLKMLIVSYTAGQWKYKIDLLQPGYYVPFNLNFVQYF